MSWGVSHLLALLTGFCLDLLLGDEMASRLLSYINEAFSIPVPGKKVRIHQMVIDHHLGPLQGLPQHGKLHALTKMINSRCACRFFFTVIINTHKAVK